MKKYLKPLEVVKKENVIRYRAQEMYSERLALYDRDSKTFFSIFESQVKYFGREITIVQEVQEKRLKYPATYEYTTLNAGTVRKDWVVEGDFAILPERVQK